MDFFPDMDLQDTTEEGRKQRNSFFRKITLETVFFFFCKLNLVFFVAVEKFWQVKRIFSLYSA